MSQSAGLDVERYRKRLMQIAVRIVGSTAEAEDAVQEAYLRWHSQPAHEVRSAQAWLTTVVSRLCIDRIRALSRESDLIGGTQRASEACASMFETPETIAELSDDLSLALVALLQQLSEDERATYVLRELLGYSYEEIATVLGKSQDAARQLLHRAKGALRHGKVKRPVAGAERERVVRAFLAAMKMGDEVTVLNLLAPRISRRASTMPLAGERVPEPASVLRKITRAVVTTWCSSDKRSLMTLLTRELLHDAGNENALFRSIQTVLDVLSSHFAQWQRDGRIEAAADPRLLAWQLFSPLIYLRFAYFQASAGKEHLSTGKKLAHRHVEYFIRLNL